MMYSREYTPDRITELKPNEIFVFGSNLAGSHGGGEARLAYNRFGAIWGQGVGLQGQSYAIPTMQGGVETIKPYVDEFIEFAKQHPEYKFLVTRIGCGIAGFKDEEIAPLFARAYDIQNIILPKEFVEVMRRDIHFPGMRYAGTYVFTSEDKATMEALPTEKLRMEYKKRLIDEGIFQLSDEWVEMPSGKFIIRNSSCRGELASTVIGFEPAEDNIKTSWTKPFNNYRQRLKCLVFPAYIEHIADNLFENIEVSDVVHLPFDLEELGNYAFANSKIGTLIIYNEALKSKYGRQLKGSTIDKLYLPESNLPLDCSKLGLLHSIVVNARVNEVALSDSVYMNWVEFLKQIE